MHWIDNKPHGKPPDKGKKSKKPKLTRPPKSDSIPTRNMLQSLDMDTGDGCSSESEYQNPLS